MQTDHANAIKGLSIAVIVLAALGIFGAIVSWIILGMSSIFVNDMGVSVISEAHSHGYTHGMEYQYGLSDQQAASAFSFLIATLGGVLSVWVLICHAVILIAGIMGLRNYNNPAKLGQVFGWAIGGAVASLMGGGLVTLILLIIVAVFANSDKKMNLTALPQANPYQQQ